MAQEIQISPYKNSFQNYKGKDTSLITTFDVDFSLIPNSYIELFIYDLNKNLVSSQQNYNNYQEYIDSLGTEATEINEITINPTEDLTSVGILEGSYIVYYNFLTPRIGSFLENLFISEISSDRKEIRLDSNSLSSVDLINQTNDFISYRNQQPYFVDFFINLGENKLLIANNIRLDEGDINNPTILIKLYDPLPQEIELNNTSWVVTTLNEPEAYQVTLPTETIEGIDDSVPLLGPNFSIPLKDQVNNSSQNLSENDILLGTSNSSYNQIQNLISSSNINIEVDYSNYEEFIHFSSAQTRLENFQYKLNLLENYSSSLSDLSGVSSSLSSKTILDSKITNIISNFDGYEYYLYYFSGSKAWPKTNSTIPYTLATVNSTEAKTWIGSTDESDPYFGGQLSSAFDFDNANPNELKKAIPEYLREDPLNQPYDLFVDMVAQYYDNVWLYTKDITQKYNADNRLDFGISKDLVADAIRDFGVKLYQNNFSNKELYTAFLGMTPSGSLFPFPEITGSVPVPTGFEFVDTLISASNDVISMDDVNKSLYKRIYHNIPYLLKSKGTLTGLRALITSYGIPDTILKISEFGGKDKVNANDYDLYFNNFNFALGVGPDLNFVSSSWGANVFWGADNNKPSTVQLRFKSEEFPPTNLSQSLWNIERLDGLSAELLLDYSGSGLISGPINGPYSGSIKDPYYQYTNLRFIPDNTQPNISASITLPFYNGDWWSVMVTTDQNNTFNLYAGNKIYNGNDGTSLGYYASSSVTGANNGIWVGRNSLGKPVATTSIFASSSLNFNSYEGFSGSLQEIRYYKPQISESVFKDYIMNPLSIEGNNTNSASEELTFRAPLGSELDTRLRIPPHTLKSVHPRITGSLPIIPSFSSNSDFYLDNAFAYNNGGTYHTNTETFFLDQPAVGIKNRTTDKIRSENSVLPSGDVLSSIRSLSQTTEASASYTDNINYLEVAFSPQNQINDDIIGQMGHFNIGDYIGDPRQRFEGTNYPDLNNLSEDYFKKYIKQYDLVDFVRLIKFFDNSLFKMIKDFIPSRTSLASGLVIKQHLLERNKYKQPEVSFENKHYSGSIEMYHISGGAGGMLNEFNGVNFAPGGNNRFSITQSWEEYNSTLIGQVSKTEDTQEEFYDGEFSGSVMLISNGELNEDCDKFKKPNYFTTPIFGYRIYNTPEYDESTFLSFDNLPTRGYISIMNVSKSISSFIPPPPSPSGILNTPTTVEVIESSSAGYTSNISAMSSQTTPNWTLNESLNNGDAISFSSAVTTNGYHMVFKNQFGEIIQGLTLDSFQVVAGAAGPSPTDVSTKFAASIEPTGVPSAANALKLKTNNLFVFMGEQFDETLEYSINISSSNTTGTSTDTTDGATFIFTPSAAWNNKGTEYSLGNTGPDSLVNSSIVVDNTLRNNLGLSGNDEVLIFPTGPNFGNVDVSNQSSNVTVNLYNGNKFLKNGRYYASTIFPENEVGLQLVTPTGIGGAAPGTPSYIFDSNYNDITQNLIHSGPAYIASDYFGFTLSIGSTPQVVAKFFYNGAAENLSWETAPGNGRFYILFTVEDANGAGIVSTTASGGTRYWCVTIDII